jgi:hypothetical protein
MNFLPHLIPLRKDSLKVQVAFSQIYFLLVYLELSFHFNPFSYLQ